MESFFRRFKGENRSLLLEAVSREELEAVVDSRMRYYEVRRHSSLGNRPLLRFLNDRHVQTELHNSEA